MSDPTGNQEIKALVMLLTDSVNELLSDRSWPSLHASDRAKGDGRPVEIGPSLGIAIAALDQLKATLLGPMGTVARALEVRRHALQLCWTAGPEKSPGLTDCGSSCTGK